MRTRKLNKSIFSKSIAFVICLIMSFTFIPFVDNEGAISDAATSTLNISNSYAITSINQGSVWSCNGVISSNYTLTNVTGTIKNAGGTVLYQKSVNPNSTSYTLKNSAIDNAMLFNKLYSGTYYYTVTAKDSSGISNVLINNKFTVGFLGSNTASALSISNASAITSINQGATWSCNGVISSNYTLTNVTGTIKNTGGTVLYQKSVNPNSISYTLKNSAIDSAMLFNKLSCGTYYYTVTAKDSSGMSKTLINNKFTVGSTSSNSSASALKISSVSAITSIKQGATWSCNGVISSNYTLTNVTGTIKTNGGTVKYQKSVNPNAKSYTLKGSVIDSAMLFNKLSSGTYYYMVTAKDSSGMSKTLINNKFTVNSNGKSSTGTTSKIKLNYSYMTNSKKQGDYSAFIVGGSNIGCMATAYAVGYSIVDKRNYSPTQFWNGSLAVDSLGRCGSYLSGFNTSDIYNNLKNGKPCLLHYYYGKSGEHWVTIIGVKAGASINSLNDSYFIAIDPAYGTEKVLTNCYKFNGGTVKGYKKF